MTDKIRYYRIRKHDYVSLITDAVLAGHLEEDSVNWEPVVVVPGECMCGRVGPDMPRHAAACTLAAITEGDET